MLSLLFFILLTEPSYTINYLFLNFIHLTKEGINYKMIMTIIIINNLIVRGGEYYARW